MSIVRQSACLELMTSEASTMDLPASTMALTTACTVKAHDCHTTRGRRSSRSNS